jgi:hypothetical protein
MVSKKSRAPLIYCGFLENKIYHEIVEVAKVETSTRDYIE